MSHQLLPLIIGLIVLAIPLTLAARRFALPYPIALTLGGVVVALLPGVPAMRLDPHLALQIFLPPALYHAAIHTSIRDFRANLRSIGLLAVALVLVTIAAVGFVVHWLTDWLMPEAALPLAACFVLGAIVSPPDAVAATAVIGRLRIPQRIVTIIEGESLLNDATSLVAFAIALDAVLTGHFALWDAPIAFLAKALGGTAIGVALAWFSLQAQKRLHDTELEVTLSLTMPFVAYMVAEWCHVSGVLSVVALGLWRSWAGINTLKPHNRLATMTSWDTFVFLINCLVFVLIGLQLPEILETVRSRYETIDLIVLAIAVSLLVIGVRLAFAFLVLWLPQRLRDRRSGRKAALPVNHIFVIGWAGMRGIVTLAAALAIPFALNDETPFPGRDLILLLAFAVIGATLIVQGTTLGPLIRWLKVGDDAAEREEERLARRAMAGAALEELYKVMAEDRYPKVLVETLKSHYETILAENTPRLGPAKAGETVHPSLAIRHELRYLGLQAERRRLLDLRRAGVVGDAVVGEIQRELDHYEASIR